MKLSEFDYNYPDELIATHPLKDRDASKMMVLDRAGEKVNHSHIKDITNFLKKGDLLVINNTRVFPARLVGKKGSGGGVEILLLKQDASPPFVKGGKGGFWRCITNQTAKLKVGARLLFDKGLVAILAARDGEELIVEFNKPELIEDVGLPPVPPYIRARRCHCEFRACRGTKQSPADSYVAQDFSPATAGRSKDLRYTPDDKTRYQTIYARHTGSAAAPTAGLHFTEELLRRIKDVGADVANITLHVGLDTFSPVREEDILKHKIHGEEYFVPDETVAAIERAKSSGGRVVAVGTTSVRALESLYSNKIPLPPPLKKGGRGGFTNLFITPGYKFRVVDAMLTNFHQPKSTLLMLVSAFAGREFILRAYEEAIKSCYRLFSYGDCMLIL